MPSTKETKSLKIKLKDIQSLGMSFEGADIETDSQAEYNFDISISHEYNFEDEIVLAIMDIKVFESSSGSKICTSKLKFAFHIKNLIRHTPNKTLDQKVVDLINTVSISTARGIIFLQSQGSPLKNIILPIVDGSTLES